MSTKNNKIKVVCIEDMDNKENSDLLLHEQAIVSFRYVDNFFWKKKEQIFCVRGKSEKYKDAIRRHIKSMWHCAEIISIKFA